MGTTRLKTSNYILTCGGGLRRHLTEALGDIFAIARAEHTQRTLSTTDHRHEASVSE